MSTFFIAATRFNLGKNIFYPFFPELFQKIDIISGAIIPVTAVLKNFFHQFCCNITKYGYAKFRVKRIFLFQFMQTGDGGGVDGGVGEEKICAPAQGMIRQKIPWATQG